MSDVQYGGIVGYIATIVAPGGLDAAQGMGWLFTLAESFPSFAIIAWAVFAREQDVCAFLARHLGGVARVFYSQTVVRRPARESQHDGLGFAERGGHHTLLGQTNSAEIYSNRRSPTFRLHVRYGFFKAAGLDGLAALNDEEARDELIMQTGRNLDYLVLGDLGRSDVQAFVFTGCRNRIAITSTPKAQRIWEAS